MNQNQEMQEATPQQEEQQSEAPEAPKIFPGALIAPQLELAKRLVEQGQVESLLPDNFPHLHPKGLIRLRRKAYKISREMNREELRSTTDETRLGLIQRDMDAEEHLQNMEENALFTKKYGPPTEDDIRRAKENANKPSMGFTANLKETETTS